MLWHKKESPQAVESHFDRNEKFGLNNVPKHFDSVTDRAIKQTERSAIEKVEQITKFNPGALKNALKSVDGQFNGAYTTLEGDYGARLAGLDNAYTQGISDLRKAFTQYQLQVAEHNIAFKNYSAANKTINGEALPENLAIPDSDTAKLEEAIKRLDERSNHA